MVSKISKAKSIEDSPSPSWLCVIASAIFNLLDCSSLQDLADVNCHTESTLCPETLQVRHPAFGIYFY